MGFKKFVKQVFSVIGVRWTDGEDVSNEKGFIVTQLKNESATDRSTMAGDQSMISWRFLKKITREQIIDEFRYAEITTPVSIVLTSVNPPIGQIEQGTTISWEVLVTFNPGMITNGDGSSGPFVVGDATNFEFINPDSSISIEAATGNTQSYTAPAYKVNLGEVTMSVLVNYPELDKTLAENRYYNSDEFQGVLLDPQRS